MATRSSLPFPPPGLPFTDANGLPNRVWIEFFMRMFQRTGGTTGGDGQLTNADVFGLEADIGQPVDIASQTASLGIALQQAFAAIAAIQHAIPPYGEAFSPGGVDQLPPEIPGVGSVQTVFHEQTLAAPAPVPQMGEMIPGMSTAALTLAEMVFPSLPVAGSIEAPHAVTPGVSPFKYAATSPQALQITGGTVSALSYSRGATSLALGVIAGGQIVEVSSGDAVTITYSVAPTITMIPR